MVGQFQGGAQHPYERAMDELFPGILLELMNQGRITQPEYQMLSNEYMRAKPAYLTKLMRMGQLAITDLRNDMINTLVSRMIQNIRGGFGMNNGMSMNGGSMFNGGGMYGQQGYGFQQQMNNMYSSQVVPNQFQQPNLLQQPQQQVITPTAPQPQQQVVAPAPTAKQDAAPVSTKWEPPTPNTALGDKKYETLGTMTMSSRYWTRSNGRVHLDAIAIENSLKYRSKEDIFRAVKQIPDLFKNAETYTVSVAYLQPVLLEVSMKEMTTLSEELIREMNSSTGSVSGNTGVANLSILRNIIENKYTNALNREVVRYLCEEINLHQNAGELCDASHTIPLMDISDIKYLEAYASRNPQMLDADTIEDLNNTEGFDSALALLVAKVVTPFIAKLKSFIVDPKASIEYLETYVNTCPRYISKDGKNYAAVPDIVKLFHQSKQHVSGSPTESAKKAKLDYEKAIGELVSRFTVMYVPRIATFSNLDPGQAIWYDDNGCIRPYIYEEATNDVSYFLFDHLQKLLSVKSDLFSRAPHEVIFENDETSIRAFYGITTDQKLWTGNEQYM